MTERPSTPSSPVQRLIDRPRITSRLLERFDHPLTFVNGPAGSGKTSAINQAIQNNLLDPRGVDFLVTLPRNGADPLQLLARIASSLGVSDEAERSTAEIRERIVEAVWSHAPDDVAVIVDDVHRVRTSDAEQVGGIDELRQLLDEMPRNGHLVLVSRHDAPVPMARLRAHGSLCEINADTLDFDDSELDELRAARAAPTSRPLPRHAATADLQLAAGADAGADFLREEVLASLHPDRLRFLQGMAVFDEFDDALVQAMSDGAIDAETLLADLPLVEWGPDGTHRLHALLRETLLSQQPAGERRKAASIGAGLLLERSQHASAVQLHLLAGDEISARDAAREFVLNPMLNQSIPEISEIRRLLATFDDTEPLRAVLEATLRFDGRDRDIADRFERAAMTARSVGDDVIEAVALHRTLQARFLDLGLGDEQRHLVDRLEELADTVPFAQGALAHARSQIAQHQGDPELALALLDAVADAGEAAVVVNRNQRLCDLGHPEDVAVGLTPGDLDRLTAGDEVFIAFAMWLRGEGTPEFANEFVNAMLDDVAGRGFDSTTISMLGTATSIAIAAGDTATARRRRDQAQDLAQQGAPRTIRLFASIARASFEADQNTDEAAGAHLDPANTGVVLDPCPHRAHLLALPLIYTVRPETRPILEATRFGPSLTTAVAAGRALVALRDEGDIGPAAALPWSLSDLLRVHVLPHHLTEFACAALRAGTPGAREALAQIPQLDRHLGRVATERRSPAAGQASDLLGRRPRRAPHTLRLDLLGDVRLLRDGERGDR